MRTLNLPETVKPVVTVVIPSYKELLDSLPEKFRTDKVKEQLKRAWDAENEIIRGYVERLRENRCSGTARMYVFNKSGCQWIADFSVNDLGKPVKDEYNWHGQNTSQWVYAGCILFDERSFDSDSDYIISRHH